MLTNFKLFEHRKIYGNSNFYKAKGYINEISKEDVSKYIPNSFDFDVTPIFRGFGTLKEGYYIINPEASERESANTSNYYTLLIHNLPSWKGYPKRKLICSSDKSVVEDQYAHNDTETAFRIVPLDENAVIGVCPSSDVWASFQYALKAFCLEKDDGQDATFLTDLLEVGGLYPDYNDIINNLEEQITRISNYDFHTNLINSVEEYEKSVFQYINIDKLVKDIKSKGALKFLDDAFSPEKNGFKKYKYKEYAKLNLSKTYNEVWLNSKCVILRTDLD